MSDSSPTQHTTDIAVAFMHRPSGSATDSPYPVTTTIEVSALLRRTTKGRSPRCRDPGRPLEGECGAADA
jgi:hypothetical protein